jgi:hypothetical protein
MALVMWHCWKFRSDGYAEREGPGGKQILIHREILGLADDDPRDGDHINHDKLDNRRENLRPATEAQSAHNRRKMNNRLTSSRYKGVHWRTNRSTWVATIHAGGKTRQLGSFPTQEGAALAYNEAARAAWGAFACLNEIPPVRVLKRW